MSSSRIRPQSCIPMQYSGSPPPPPISPSLADGQSALPESGGAVDRARRGWGSVRSSDGGGRATRYRKPLIGIILHSRAASGSPLPNPDSILHFHALSTGAPPSSPISHCRRRQATLQNMPGSATPMGAAGPRDNRKPLSSIIVHSRAVSREPLSESGNQSCIPIPGSSAILANSVVHGASTPPPTGCRETRRLFRYLSGISKTRTAALSQRNPALPRAILDLGKAVEIAPDSRASFQLQALAATAFVIRGGETRKGWAAASDRSPSQLVRAKPKPDGSPIPCRARRQDNGWAFSPNFQRIEMPAPSGRAGGGKRQNLPYQPHKWKLPPRHSDFVTPRQGKKQPPPNPKRS